MIDGWGKIAAVLGQYISVVAEPSFEESRFNETNNI
jgi:hypothetical protein